MTGFGFAAQALQVGAHVGSVLVTGLAIFLEGFVDDVFEFRGDIWIQAHWAGLRRGS